MVFLSPSEQNYLSNNEQFSKAKQRYIRYRLNRKLRLLGEDLTSGGISQDIAVATAPPASVAATVHTCYCHGLVAIIHLHESKKVISGLGGMELKIQTSPLLDALP